MNADAKTTPAPRLTTTDSDPSIYTAPYFVERQLSEMLGGAIEDALEAILPGLLPPLIDDAVRQIALLKAGDTATGPIMTTQLLPSVDAEFVTKAYIDSLAGGGVVAVVTDGVSILGDGTGIDPLAVDRIDCGTYTTLLGHEWQAAALSDQQHSHRVLHLRKGPR